MNSREAATAYRMTQWTGLLQERAKCGESISDFCQNRGIKRHQYFYWQRKLRAAACKQMAISQSSETSFAEIKLEPRQLALPPAAEPGQIRVNVDGVQITADSTYPPDKLASFVRELTRP